VSACYINVSISSQAECRTGDAMVATTLNIERDEISSKSLRWILSEQVNGDLVSDEAIKLLYRLTAETT